MDPATPMNKHRAESARPSVCLHGLIMALLAASVLAVALAGPSSPAFAATAAATARAVSVVSEEPGGVTLIFETPPATWQVMGEYAYPAIPGFTVVQSPGRPAIPVKVARVGIPAGATPRIEILDVRTAPSRPGKIGPVQRWVPLLPGSDERVPVTTEDPEIYSADTPFPSADPVRLGQSGALREQPFVELMFTPIVYDPAKRESTQYTRVTVRVDFGVAIPPATAGEDADFDRLYDSAVVNAKQARAFRGTQVAGVEKTGASGAAAMSVDTALSTKYKLTINKDGIYRLSASWLQTNAPAILTYAPGSYRLDCQGIQVPITVVDANADGTLSGSDYIEFYGQALTWDLLDPDEWDSGDYTDDNVYWLYADSAPGLRIPTRASAPTDVFPVPADFKFTSHHEVNSRFVQQVPQDGLEHWYEEPPVVANGSAASVVFTAETPGPSTSSSLVSMKVRLLGDNYFNNYHRTTIKVNGTTVSGPIDWDGFREYTVGVDNGQVLFSQSLINDASPDTTSVTVSAPLGRTVGGTAITYDTVYLNWIEITYGRQYKVDAADTLTFSNANQNNQFKVTGLSQNASAVYEITNTLAGGHLVSPVRITGTRASGSGTYNVEFEMPVDGGLPGGTVRRFIVSTITSSGTTGDLLPAAVAAGKTPYLKNPATGADWLAVYNSTLVDTTPGSAWLQLLQRRTSQGLRVVTVDVQDVYDEFSWGIQDPQAIRDFFAYVYAYWPRVQPGVPLRYGVLVGDASLDYKNNYGWGSNKNLLSTYMRSVSESSTLGYMGDESYFAAVSGSDALPDFYLGRWPVHNTSETDWVSQKILNYETQTTGQAWQHNVVFVADDDSAFETVQDRQIANYLQGTAHTWNRAYELQVEAAHPTWTGTQVAAEMNLRLHYDFDGTVDATRDTGPGAAVLSYVGHGSWQTWGSNNSFWTVASSGTDDSTSLHNSSKLPLMVVADCITGAFYVLAKPSAPTDLTYSFSEQMLVARGTTDALHPKGAIGIIAPAHLTYVNGHDTVESVFFGEAYGPTKTRNLGSLLLSIQLAFGEANDLIDLRSFNLVGDPAVNLVIPAPAPPSSVSATGGNNQVTVTWSAAPGASKYSVYQATSPGGPYVRVAMEVNGTSYTVQNLINCTTYYYAVASVDSGHFEGAWSGFNTGCGAGGSCVTATPKNPLTPTAPVGVAATDNQSGGSVVVSWTANAGSQEVTNYRIYWGTAPGVYTSFQDSGPGTSFLVTGLTNGTTYYFAVSAINCSHGEGPKSGYAVGVPHRIDGIKPPQQVSDLMIYRNVDLVDHIDNTRLGWTPPTTNVYGQPTTLDHQEVYAGTTPLFPTDGAHLLANVGPTAGTYIHANAYASPTFWYYLVVAVDASGNRSGIGRNLPNGVDDLRLSLLRGALALTWTPVTKDMDGLDTLVDHYVLYGSANPFRRSQITPAMIVPGYGNITSTSTSIPTPAGTLYCYSIITVDNRGAVSPW